MEYVNYTLPGQTLLDGRYLIEKVIGEGGFGITYEAVNTALNTKVAIKEFYFHEYVTRDVSKSTHILFSNPEKKDSYEKARARFLREARIVRDFSDEENVVSILDYFEENDTAYIVMEYLEGSTLKDYVSEHDPFDPEKFGLMLVPLIKALKRIHDAGIIHRDISPDNIMLMPNGKLCLMDFGAARSYFAASEKSTSVISKKGYTPCEQYDEGMKQGPWSDIYSLSAVYYYCITGKVPDSSLQRLLLDTLTMPSKQGVKISQNLENVLATGLAVFPEKRYDSLDNFLKDLEKCLPKENPNPKKKLKIRLTVAAGLILSVLIATFIFYRTHQEFFLFLNTETETVILYQDDKNDELLARDAEVIEQRVKHLVGSDQYIVSKEDGYIRCVFPKKCLDGYSMRDGIRYAVSRPACPYFDNSTLEKVDFSNLEFEESDDGFYLVFSLADRYCELMDNGNNHYLYLDEGLDDCFYSLIEKYGDDRYRITLPNNRNVAETMYYNLTENSLTEALYIEYEIEAIWEDASTTMLKGENQVNADDISESYVIQEFYPFVYDDNEVSQGEWYHSVSDIKTRLDSLGVPYAFGTDPNGEKHILVKIAQKNYYGTFRDILFEHSFDFEIDLGSKYFGLGYFDMDITETSEGIYSVNLCYDSFSEDDYNEAVKTLAESDDPVISLKYNGLIIAQGELTETDSTELHFTSYGTSGEAITVETVPVFHLIETIAFKTDIPVNYYYYSTEIGSGNTGIQKITESMESWATNAENEKKILDEINAILPEGGRCEAYFDPDYKLCITLPYEFIDSSDSESAYQFVKKIFMICLSYDFQPNNVTVQQLEQNDSRYLTGKFTIQAEHLSNIYLWAYSYVREFDDCYDEIEKKLKSDPEIKGYLYISDSNS